jgi:hypothetical protein
VIFLSQALQKPQIRHNQSNKINMMGATGWAITAYSSREMLENTEGQPKMDNLR